MRATLEFQQDLNVDGLVSPTVPFDSFNDSWSQIALSLGAEAIEQRDQLDMNDRLLLSFLIGNSAFSDNDAVDQFLDDISVWEMDGIYLIVNQPNIGYPAQLIAEQLANIMYVTYSLANLNELDVIIGYSDLSGVLMHAVGASAIATGWYASLRQFSSLRWQPSTGGRAPRPRYTSAPLLCSILQIPELSTAYTVDMLDLCLSDAEHDEAFDNTNPADVDWPLAIQCLHHWDSLHSIIEEIDSEDISSNLDTVLAKIEEAREFYGRLGSAGVQFEHASGGHHLDIWENAINQFRQKVGL